MKETAADAIADTLGWLIPSLLKSYLPLEMYEKNRGKIFGMILDGALTSGTLKQDK